jgi:PASTA domain
MPALDPEDIVKGLEELVPGRRLPRRVSVPDVVGLKVSVASTMLAREGLRVVTHVAVVSPPPVEGVVVRQSLPPGERVSAELPWSCCSTSPVMDLSNVARR